MISAIKKKKRNMGEGDRKFKEVVMKFAVLNLVIEKVILEKRPESGMGANAKIQKWKLLVIFFFWGGSVLKPSK